MTRGITPEAGEAQPLNQPPETSHSNWMRRLRGHSCIIVPGLIFLAAVIASNWRLFTTRFVERGDVAVNALQVQNAMHFRELLGNCSRWHIHHPGPFFFYLFAAGEALFYRLLHLVPAPLNGEYLAEIIFSTACLFLAIRIASLHVHERLFGPLAVFFSVVFLQTLNAAIPGSALLSVWPPYMAMSCFLLMMVCCASVAAGNWKHTPILGFAGMAMIHSHVAQVLFVTVLCSASLCVAAARDFRYGRLPEALSSHRRYLAAMLGIVALFMLPIVLDAAIHHPNNIDRIRLYLRAHHGEHNSWHVSLLYLASFFTYSMTPDTVLANPGARFRDILNPAPFVSGYWTIFLATALTAGVAAAWAKRRIPLFVRYIFAEIAAVSLLFLYWGWRITGPMFTFNGYFFFIVQLLALFGFAALIAISVRWRPGPRTAFALACGFAPLIAFSEGTKVGEAPAPEIETIVAAVRARHPKTVELVMPRTIPTVKPGCGVASYLRRARINFCFSPEWEFEFGPSHVCTPGTEDQRYIVQFNEKATPCENPCSVIYAGPNLYVTGTPPGPTFESLPVLIRASQRKYLHSGFNDNDQNGAWSKDTATVRFYVGAQPTQADRYLLHTLGIGLPGRPAYVSFNGALIGTILTPEHREQTFTVPAGLIVWNGANTITFRVPNAGPLGSDTRKLGYFVEDVILQKSDSNAVIKQVPETVAERVVPGITWQTDGGWAPSGFNPEIGRLTVGTMWGSWNQNDALTGRLTSEPFQPDPAGCVVVPLGHGPSIINQRVAVTTESGKLITDIPLQSDTGTWKLSEVHYDPAVKQVSISAEDEGRGWGQWLAVGEPRSCGE